MPSRKKLPRVIRREYAEPVYFNYIEQGRDVDISMLGKISVGPMQTFEVRQDPPGGAWRRLIAVDGKPLDTAPNWRGRDDEHRKKVERDGPKRRVQRTVRLKREAEELRERDEILDDAERVFAFSYVGRETD